MNYLFYKSHLKILSIVFIFFTFNLFSFEGYVAIKKDITDVSWDFLPTTNSSFNYSESINKELFVAQNNFGIKLSNSTFNLDLERSTYPKKLALNAESETLELFYLNDEATFAYSVSFKEQVADPQVINCYTFDSLTIGSCEEASLNISNSKAKYDSLGNALISIDGRNKSLKFNITTISNLNLIDEYSFFLEITENNFNWISPVEEITSGFIANLTYRGRRIGDLIDDTLDILPQRDSWNTVVAGLDLKKSINISKNLSFFIDPSLVLVEQLDYRNINKLIKYNFKLKSGLVINYDKLEASFYGTYYHNNLYGFEHISFNQRSEHHFNSNYGSLGVSINYNF